MAPLGVIDLHKILKIYYNFVNNFRNCQSIAPSVMVYIIAQYYVCNISFGFSFIRNF